MSGQSVVTPNGATILAYAFSRLFRTPGPPRPFATNCTRPSTVEEHQDTHIPPPRPAKSRHGSGRSNRLTLIDVFWDTHVASCFLGHPRCVFLGCVFLGHPRGVGGCRPDRRAAAPRGRGSKTGKLGQMCAGAPHVPAKRAACGHANAGAAGACIRSPVRERAKRSRVRSGPCPARAAHRPARVRVRRRSRPACGSCGSPACCRSGAPGGR